MRIFVSDLAILTSAYHPVPLYIKKKRTPDFAVRSFYGSFTDSDRKFFFGFSHEQGAPCRTNGCLETNTGSVFRSSLATILWPSGDVIMNNFCGFSMSESC